MGDVLRRVIAVGLLMWGAGAGAASTFPDKSLKIIVPFGPGGATDLTGRVLAESMSQQLGQPVVVENKPGGSTSIGASAVARAPADGYTLLVSGSSTYTVVPALRNDLPYDPLTSFDLIGIVADAPMVLVVNEKSPFQSVEELIKAAKASNKELSYATFGPGSAPHLIGEMFALAAGIKLMPVPYRGSAPTMMALIGGEINMAVDTLSSALPHIQAGKVRPLAVFSEERVQVLPGVATIKELGLPDATFSGWYAMVAPIGLPDDVRKKLSAVLEQAMQSPAVRATMEKSVLQPIFLDASAFRSRMTKELNTFRSVAERAQIRIE